MAWELAQLNVAAWAVDPDGPEASAFHAALDEVNARAEGADGFRWRLPDEPPAPDDPPAPPPFGGGWVANLTVWRDVDALERFTYADERHAAVLRDRRRWFRRGGSPTTVLWWVPAGHRPTPAEATARLEQLRADGPTAAAFTFAHRFPAPGGAA